MVVKSHSNAVHFLKLGNKSLILSLLDSCSTLDTTFAQEKSSSKVTNAYMGLDTFNLIPSFLSSHKTT